MNQFETFVAAVLGGGLSVWGGHLMAAPTPAVLLGTVLSVWGGVLVGNPIIAGLRREHGAGLTRGSNGMKFWPFGRRNGNGKHTVPTVSAWVPPQATKLDPFKRADARMHVGHGVADEAYLATALLWPAPRLASKGLI